MRIETICWLQFILLGVEPLNLNEIDFVEEWIGLEK